MPEFVAVRLSQMGSQEQTFLEISEMREASSKRVLYLIKSKASDESRDMKRSARFCGGIARVKTTRERPTKK